MDSWGNNAPHVQGAAGPAASERLSLQIVLALQLEAGSWRCIRVPAANGSSGRIFV